MAGHSQFKNIMHRKGAQDARSRKLFGKLAREITVAARARPAGPGDERAAARRHHRGARRRTCRRTRSTAPSRRRSGGDGEDYDEIRYEGYGPAGVAVIVEALTDNRNRTASDVRSDFTKNGGNLAETGAVSFMFDHVGVIDSTPRWPPPTPCWRRRSRPAPTTWCPARAATRSTHRREFLRGGRQGAGGQVRRAAQGRPGLEAAEHGCRSTTSRAKSSSS